MVGMRVDILDDHRLALRPSLTAHPAPERNPRTRQRPLKRRQNQFVRTRIDQIKTHPKPAERLLQNRRRVRQIRHPIRLVRHHRLNLRQYLPIKRGLVRSRKMKRVHSHVLYMCISSSYYKTGRLKQHFRRPQAAIPYPNIPPVSSCEPVAYPLNFTLHRTTRSVQPKKHNTEQKRCITKSECGIKNGSSATGK